MGGRTSAASHNKYNAKAYDRINLVVRKGQKEQIQEYAKEKGMSLNAYINEQKIEYSKQELLRRRDVNAVADALNFSTPSYFISLFKAHVGMTPKQFIREGSGKKRTEQEP